MHLGEKTPRGFQLAIHKRGIEDQLCSFVGDLRLTPLLYLTTHRLKAPLNPINTYGEVCFARTGVNPLEASLPKRWVAPSPVSPLVCASVSAFDDVQGLLLNVGREVVRATHRRGFSGLRAG
jgi:hypothetical protein